MELKIAFLIIVVSVSNLLATDTYSQVAKVSLDMENKSLEQVMDEIEKQSEFYFIFNQKQIDVHRIVDIQADNKLIADILPELFNGTNVYYVVFDRKILLTTDPLDNNLLAIALGSEPQQKQITGTVTDKFGNPMPGVNVVVTGTTQGTITDIAGKYSIEVPQGSKSLTFSFVGMEPQEITIGTLTQINVTMVESAIDLEEVVVVGYGTMEKRAVTSSITSVRNKDLIPGVSGNPLIAMQEKVTGLTIQSDNGTSPNAGISVQLRGIASILAGQGPLIVIDGVPGGSLNSVSREDIQSIDILKDASAGAIYGTRAAGGVILITTKQAKEGSLRLTYTSELSTETIRRKPEVLSAKEFVDNNLGTDHGHVTDWYDEVTVNYPFRQRHHVNLNGGSKTSKIYATFVASDQEGIAIGDTRQEVEGRINTNFTLLDGFIEIITHTDYRRSLIERSDNGIFEQALKLNPTLSPYDESQVHGLNVWTGGWDYNPVADIKLKDDQGKDYNFLGDVTLKLNLTSHLSTEAKVATRNNQYRNIYYQTAQHKTSLDQTRRGYGSQSYGESNDKTFEWLVNYGNEFGNHRVSVVGGYSFQEFNGDGFDINNADFPVDGIKVWDMSTGTFLTAGKAGMDSWKDPRERLIAFFARANYSYQDKYILTVSGRYEGSSKFYVDNRWGLFPAISAGWRISNESFMDGLGFINDLKLRAGYGVTGNQSFSPGVATRMYKSSSWWLVNGAWITTYSSAQNQNKDLQWEEKKELNIGADFTLFNNKLAGKFDIYNRKVDKMIYDISVSVPPAIYNKTTMNVGVLRNKGWEAELSYNVIQTNTWSYNTTMRISHNKSVLTTLSGSQTYWDRVRFPPPGDPGMGVRLFPGQEIGKFYVWRFAGFTEEGNWMLYDKDGQAFDVTQRTKTLEDKVFLGNAIPKIRLSSDHTIRYKNWELNAFFTSWLGHDVFNTINLYYGLPNVEQQNVLRNAFDEHKNIKGEKELCDYWIEDADFVKLKALTLRYNFSTSNLGFIQNANVYLTGRNLFTITKYSGMDPESNINGLDPGFEWFDNLYPQTREFVLGIQLIF